MNEAAIEIRGLRKSYAGEDAVAGIDLQVVRGEVFALLGPNGAGKTTTVEILEGHRQRDAGEVRVLGFDPGKLEPAFRQRVGIVLQETGVERYLTVTETLELFGSYYLRPRPVSEVVELVGLAEQAQQRVRRLSGGQKRRLDVAVGLIGDPDLLFLDEPTTGFDPAARREAWEMIRGLQDLGKTIFLTTHYMDEAEHLADRVAIIKRGQIIVSGAPRTILATEPLTAIRFTAGESSQALLEGLTGWRLEEGSVVLETATVTETLHALTSRALTLGVELSDLSVSRPTLEDLYIKLVSEEAPS